MIGLQPYRDILNPVPPIWKDISLDWYKSLLEKAEEMEIPKHCDTCKWWGAEEPLNTWWDMIYRLCNAPKNGSESKPDEAHYFEVHSWKDGIGYEKPSPPEDGSYAFAVADSPALWITGAKFGCIHWESK